MLKQDLHSDVWAFVVRNLDRAQRKPPQYTQKTVFRGIFADSDAIARR